jgi:organic hydroperoxide reductase OsmC/OhrA
VVEPVETTPPDLDKLDHRWVELVENHGGFNGCMSISKHSYEVTVNWTGNRGTGTSGYRSYGRDHEVTAAGLPVLLGSADPTFHGDRDRWNPEQLLLTALAQCHMLSYLHVAVLHGVCVTSYTDTAVGTLALNRDGSGQFSSVTLRPRLSVADPATAGLAADLHAEAAAKCFIARSVNFPVLHEPVVTAD